MIYIFCFDNDGGVEFDFVLAEIGGVELYVAVGGGIEVSISPKVAVSIIIEELQEEINQNFDFSVFE